jgi:hypothetical protein
MTAAVTTKITTGLTRSVTIDPFIEGEIYPFRITDVNRRAFNATNINNGKNLDRS